MPNRAPTPRSAAVTTEVVAPCPLAITLAARMRESRDDLTMRWLTRISERVSIDEQRIFPTEELLDHVPLLIDGVADFVEDPARSVGADAPVIAKARELGALRYEQGFDEYEILKEFEILGGILIAFLARIVDGIDEECTRGELLTCAQRLFGAVSVIQQSTATQYLHLMKSRLTEREERLRGFNRSLTHELKNRIGAALGAAELLEMEDIPLEHRSKMLGIVVRNVADMRTILDNLVELTRLDRDNRQQRHVTLPNATAEVLRQLREMARVAGVRVELEKLPDVEVSAAAVELVLTNLVSNAIKYSDTSKGQRWVRVSARLESSDESAPCNLVVEVRDNGLGVPYERRAHLFTRFYRAHEDSQREVEGSGLGLSIVRETVEEMGGRVWAEFPEEGGSLFAFTIPCRRGDDAERLAT